MNPLLIKGIGLILVIALLVGLGYHRGSASATREFLPQIEQLKAVIEASDAQAQETIIEQEKNYDQISSSHSANVARVVAFYDSLLRKARDKAGSSTVTVNPCQPDGSIANIDSGKGGCSIEFEQQCIITAMTVIGFKEYIINNNIPIK